MACTGFICSVCKCDGKLPTCYVCVVMKYKCTGTCFCCQEYRKELNSDTSTDDVPAPYCRYCHCESDTSKCKDCSKRKFVCPGTCLCCKDSKKHKSTTDKALDNKSSTVEPNNETGQRDERILLPRVSHQQSPGITQARILTSEDKNMKGKCPRCFCKGDNIPCYLCQFPDFRCFGVCNCCSGRNAASACFVPDSKNVQRGMYCPRCLCKPGEGSCNECRKQLERCSTVVPPKNRPSTSSLALHQRENLAPESANYIQLYSHPSELRIPPIPRSAPSATVFIPNRPSTSSFALHQRENRAPESANYVQSYCRPSRFLVPPARLTPSAIAYIQRTQGNNSLFPNCTLLKEEYCLNCECRKGKEPCEICKRDDFQCLGSCRCCMTFNDQLMEINALKDIPENHDPPEPPAAPIEFPDIRKLLRRKPSKKTSPKVKTEIICFSSRDHSYSQIIKCDGCDCIKYRMTCNECIFSFPACIFLGDTTYCSCCAIDVES